MMPMGSPWRLVLLFACACAYSAPGKGGDTDAAPLILTVGRYALTHDRYYRSAFGKSSGTIGQVAAGTAVEVQQSYTVDGVYEAEFTTDEGEHGWMSVLEADLKKLQPGEGSAATTEPADTPSVTATPSVPGKTDGVARAAAEHAPLAAPIAIAPLDLAAWDSSYGKFAMLAVAIFALQGMFTGKGGAPTPSSAPMFALPPALSPAPAPEPSPAPSPTAMKAKRRSSAAVRFSYRPVATFQLR